MKNHKIYKRRIEQFIDRVYGMRYSDPVCLKAAYIYNKKAPIPYETAKTASYKPIKVGTKWGDLWGCAWFKIEGSVPASHDGKEVVALIDIGGEGCVFDNGTPVRGITYAAREAGPHVKRRIPVGNPARKGQKVSFLLEAGANDLFGLLPKHLPLEEPFCLRQAELAVFHRDIWELALDMKVLVDLAASLPENQPRARKIYYGLNEAANRWNGGAGLEGCRKITSQLLGKKANASDMTAWSIGHAHIDLAWLWPVRETRRKAGRSFSTALRLMEEYPEYKFGASQPQLYEWVQEDYPDLFPAVKKAVKKGSWELQGAMWVEPDMNITGGESLVRQCLYGKNYFRKEFGEEIRNLWLPDVFGYTAALPQILLKAGVDLFMTQKISWNERNTFPHHTFLWEGIDGSKILTHFLPTNSYNLENRPAELIAAQERFAESESQDDFLNLYGIGDGGGGPSRLHIEYGRRLQNTEGSPKVKFAFAEEYFRKIRRIPKSTLPAWAGELYLELHRGTLTTQAKMKRNNRQLELALREVEFLSVMAGTWDKKTLDEIWKNTLLNQFHDILPGSSIGWVYKEAHALSEKNLLRLRDLKEKAMAALFKPKAKSTVFILINTQPWERQEVIVLPAAGVPAAGIPAAGSGGYVAFDAEGNELDTCSAGTMIYTRPVVPSMGYTTIRLAKGEARRITAGVICTKSTLKNRYLRIRLAADGTISSIFDKKSRRETLDGAANKMLLWEDLPYTYDAWDISQYYRETKPVPATLETRNVAVETPLLCVIEQVLKVGASVIRQRISLEKDSRLITIENTVDWNESGKLLKVHAETSVFARTATYEIQFGQVERPTHGNTSWDEARFEVAGQRYADISEDGYGFAVVNDSKYGYSTYGNSIELSLLRSPKSPDPTADIGRHEFTFGYLPHADDLARSHVVETAHNLNSPVIVHNSSAVPNPSTESWFAVDGDHVKLETVKQAENGDGTILRLYETGGGTRDVTLHSARLWKNVTETDLLENPAKAPESTSLPAAKAAGREGDKNSGTSIRMRFKPYEIRTLRLS